MKRLLYLCHRVPYPPDKGERVRAFQEILALREHFSVSLAALAFDPDEHDCAEPLYDWCEEVYIARAGGPRGLLRGARSLLGGRSLTEGYFHSPQLHRRLAGAADRRPFDIAVCFSSAMLPYALPLRGLPLVVDLCDVDSAKWAAYARRSGGVGGWLYGVESRRVAALERLARRRADALALVSAAEAALAPPGPARLLVAENGVDAIHFDPALVAPAPVEGASIVFTGSMGYRPNVEGVCWFVREVWPHLRAGVPQLTFTIVGRDPARPVRRLARVAGVRVTGTVGDVRPFLASADVVVCPLHTARGVQNKVLEAMAMARPVVASPQALEGIDCGIGAHALLADTPDEWTDALLALLADRARRQSLGAAARAHVLAHYTWPARLRPLVDACLQLTHQPPAPPVNRPNTSGDERR